MGETNPVPTTFFPPLETLFLSELFNKIKSRYEWKTSVKDIWYYIFNKSLIYILRSAGRCIICCHGYRVREGCAVITDLMPEIVLAHPETTCCYLVILGSCDG